jgi:hypothetical protein
VVGHPVFFLLDGAEEEKDGATDDARQAHKISKSKRNEKKMIGFP